MMLVPKVFSPKNCNDMNLFTGKLENAWASLKTPTCPSLLVNVTYNPIKNKIALNFWTKLQLTSIMLLRKRKR